MTSRLLAAAALLAIAPARAAVPTTPAPPAAVPADDETWPLDQIRVAGIADAARLEALANDHSMAAVAAHLRRMGLAFTRAPVSLRVSDLPGGIVAQVRALPKGEPFVLAADGIVTVSAIQPAPVAGARAWQPAIKGEPNGAQLAAARHFLDVAIPPAEREHFFDRIIDQTMANIIGGMLRTQQLQQLLGAHAALRPIFAQFASRQRELTMTDMHAHLAQLIEAQVIGYARLFNVDELNQLSGFFSQPIGRKYLQQTLLLAQQPEIAAWQQGMTARAQARLPSEMQGLMAQVRAALAKEKNNDVS